MFVNRESKKYIEMLLDDDNIVYEIDAKNWDKVYKYFTDFLEQECENHHYIDESEITADLTRLLLDSGINPLEGRNHIPGFTFYGKFKLKDIPEIPSSIKAIDSYAYYELVTKKPMELRIPGTVKEIGICAITVCNDITKIIIEDGVEGIDHHAIHRCDNLEYIELPNSLKKIGYLVDTEENPRYRKTVIKFNGSADEFRNLLRAEVTRNRYIDLFGHFGKLHVIDKNNERIEL